MGGVKTCILLLILTLVVITPITTANIGEFDEVWQKRAEEAQKEALKAYEPNPEIVTQEFNNEVNT